MSSAESWFEVQTAQAEQNALVGHLADQLLRAGHDATVFLGRVERLAELRAQKGKRLSDQSLESLRQLEDLLGQTVALIEELRSNGS